MYLYETHLHTAQGSLCGVSEGREYPALYKALGYSGIFITDHFFQGNCAVDRSLPWEEKIRLYMLGYLDAKAEGDCIGFDVFFGIEQNYGCDEYLLYGIDREFLLAHPDMESWPRSRLIDEVHAIGGCVIQAHPFRERAYIKTVRLSPYTVDGVEGVNMGNRPSEDLAAIHYAQKLNLTMTCGSDIHSAQKVNPQCAGGTLVSERLTCPKDYARAVLGGRIKGMKFPPERFLDAECGYPSLPVEVFGKDDSVTGDSADIWLPKR